MDDLQGIKVYVAKQFGETKAKACAEEISAATKPLELFPGEGSRFKDLIKYPTDYHYLAVKTNYVIYRVEGDT